MGVEGAGTVVLDHIQATDIEDISLNSTGTYLLNSSSGVLRHISSP